MTFYRKTSTSDVTIAAADRIDFRLVLRDVCWDLPFTQAQITGPLTVTMWDPFSWTLTTNPYMKTDWPSYYTYCGNGFTMNLQYQMTNVGDIPVETDT